MDTALEANMHQGVQVAARAVEAVKIYGEGGAAVRALAGVTVEFPTGRFSAIMGPSGSGKSTLLHCMPASTGSPRARSSSATSISALWTRSA